MRFVFKNLLALTLIWASLPATLAAQAPAVTPTDAPPAEAAEIVAPAPPPPPMTTLLVAVNADDAEIRVDGEVVGQSPLAPIELSVGRHVVQVSRPGFHAGSRSLDLTTEGGRADFSLELDPEQATALEPELEPEDVAAGGPDWYRRWYVWAGAGGALVLGAVIIGVAASSGGGSSGYPLPPIQP